MAIVSSVSLIKNWMEVKIEMNSENRMDRSQETAYVDIAFNSIHVFRLNALTPSRFRLFIVHSRVISLHTLRYYSLEIEFSSLIVNN